MCKRDEAGAARGRHRREQALARGTSAARDSEHAVERASERGIDDEAVAVALKFGDAIPQAHHRTAYFVSAAAVVRAARVGDDIGHFMNVAVVVAPDGTIVTVVRSSEERMRGWKPSKSRRSHKRRAS